MDALSLPTMNALVFACLKGAGIGFLAGLLFTLVAGKFGLWRRSTKVHAGLVKLYYLYIPLVFAAFLAAWSGQSFVRGEINKLMTDLRPSVTEFSLSLADTVMSEIRSANKNEDLSLMEIVHMAKNLVRVHVKERIDALPAYAREVIRPVQALVTDYIVELVKEKLIKKAAGKFNISEKHLALLLESGVEETLRSGIVMDAIENTVESKLAPIVRSICIFGFLLILPVILETGISLYRDRRRTRQAQAV